MNEQQVLNQESQQPLPPNPNKEKKKGSKVLIAIIIFLLFTLLAGGAYVYKTYIADDGKAQTEEKQKSDGGEIVRDYEFDESGKPVPVKAPNIGMAIKSAILGNVNGKAEMAIKNSGDIPIEPKVIYNGKTIYQSPTLKPGEAVKANLEFGELAVGEYDFTVLAMYQGGSGLSLKSKVVVFEPGTEVKIKDDSK
ncbi:hypothetical protein CVD28_02900 [Bacillus sp. M6-12]|uniref:hypothetical protein n=1 Tax=Bacillus sp. M6-12 TaxID=2054166 RepID=UPI000C765CBE|nr:hypothetical protein [Bacillus sp. M6-12]PLS19380.1 hypothetical protein CVD28_02900 [Bacillus sp. M6-12]